MKIESTTCSLHRRRGRPGAAIVFFSCAALCVGLMGCRSAPTISEYARPYPESARHAKDTLNVQVFRRVKTVDFTNTSVRAFGKSTIWLNKRYSAPIDSIAIGERVEMRLSNFKDEVSDTFRGGGFFASEAPETLVIAEIETPGEDGQPMLYGLVVVKGSIE